MSVDIGRRVVRLMSDSEVRLTQKDLAKLVGMTPDAFSRAINGKRAFSALEIAQIAERLQGDVHWLITGESDPSRVLVAARHDFDAESKSRSVAGYASDREVLDSVAVAYQQAYLGADLPTSSVPHSASEVREVLGPDFVRPFIDRLEEKLGVDVVRVAGLSTSYCIEIDGRHTILVAATGNWFRENWSIAHETGHVACKHAFQDGFPSDADEAEANAFAAELLLPADVISGMDWLGINAEVLAARVWDLGVSTDALSRRLNALGIDAAEMVNDWACQPTQRLLRRHWQGNVGGADEITTRMDDASTRRFPVALQEAHLKKIATGDLGKDTLAWMLGIDAAELEVDAPSIVEIDPDDLARALEL